ncbi:MAG: hypothetical protein HY928_04980 [Elusimicrobia bacterium]|nr:hypothetical protein [Elusimicrobiota bacterium]
MSAAGRCGPFAGAAGAAAASVGVSVLVGWWSGVGVLKSLFPGLVAMNPVTAVCFVLTGLALRRLAAPEPRTGLARACAGAVVVLACLRLAGCLFGWDLGVDRLLFTAALDAGPSGIPNRMAPNTAANFLLLGSALLLLGARFRRDLWAQALAVLVAGVSFLALLGYAYGAKQLYRLALFMPMAVNTAVTFFVTAAGVVCATAEVGVMPLLTGDSAAGHAARRLLPMSVVVPTLCGWLTLRGAAAGLFSTEFGTSLLVTAIIVVFLTVIYWNAETLHGMELAKDEANAALKHAHDDLEVRVQDRTADLRREMGEKSRLQSQLVQSQKMEAVGRLAGGVAHDFNNILTAIGGYCGFLLDGLRPGDPRHDDLDEIRKAGDRAAALTRQLLAFSRRQVLASQVLDLNALIADMERMLGRIIGEDVELKTALAPSLGRIQGDQGQVEQVLLNLVINA